MRIFQKLAADIGIKRCYVIGSKILSGNDEQFISDHLKGFEILGFIDYNSEIATADRLEQTFMNLRRNLFPVS